MVRICGWCGEYLGERCDNPACCHLYRDNRNKSGRPACPLCGRESSTSTTTGICEFEARLFKTEKVSA